MTELERKALKLRRERLKKQLSSTKNDSLQNKAKQFSSEWRKSIAIKAVCA